MSKTIVEVLREFPGANRTLHQAGEILDASEWRNLASLIERRYVRITTKKLKAEAETQE